jgi:hypothetical protein
MRDVEAGTTNGKKKSTPFLFGAFSANILVLLPNIFFFPFFLRFCVAHNLLFSSSFFCRTERKERKVQSTLALTRSKQGPKKKQKKQCRFRISRCTKTAFVSIEGKFSIP